MNIKVNYEVTTFRYEPMWEDKGVWYFNCVVGMTEGGEVLLGYYEDEARALSVMDEMEQALRNEEGYEIPKQ